MLKAKRWFLWGWSALASILVILWLYFRKPIYPAKLTCVFKEDSQSSLMAGLSGLSSILGSGTSPSSLSPLDRVIDLGQSEQIQTKTLLQEVRIDGRLDLMINHFLRLHRYKTKWQKIDYGPDTILRDARYFANTNYQNLTPSQRRGIQIVRKDLEDALSISFNKKSGVIFLEYKDKNQELASAFCQHLYQQLVVFYTYQATATLKMRVETLQSKVDSIQSALNATQSASATTSDQALGLLLQKDRVVQKRLGLRENTLVIMYGEALKNLEQLNFLLTTTTPTFTVIDYPYLPLKPERKNIILFGLVTFIIALCLLTVYSALKHAFWSHFLN